MMSGQAPDVKLYQLCLRECLCRFCQGPVSDTLTVEYSPRVAAGIFIIDVILPIDFFPMCVHSNQSMLSSPQHWWQKWSDQFPAAHEEGERSHRTVYTTSAE